MFISRGRISLIPRTGLGSIFTLRRFARAIGARLVVTRPSANITRLLDTVNMQALIPVTASLEEARLSLAAVGPGAAS